MSIFKEIGLSWKGKEYVVSPDKVMGLIEVIEDILTLEEMNIVSGIKRSKISKAYASAIRYAAQNSSPRQECSITQQDVYESLFSIEDGGNIGQIINSLLFMMVPPKHLQDNSGNEKAEQAIKAQEEKNTKENDS